MDGIAITKRGIGDGLQFSSVPENYFRHTGNKLLDMDLPWFFDSSPYVVRDSNIKPDKVIQMWNFPSLYPWPDPRIELPIKGDLYPVPSRPKVYLSNAEIWASVWNVPVVLNRPRLYRFEDFPFEKRKRILFQTNGRSHGELPKHIIAHVIKKYRPTNELFHIGDKCSNFEDLEIPHLNTPNLWDLAELISQARIVIGPDSGIPWIATCYPDIIVKVVRTKPLPDLFKKWIPLEQSNIHSFWDSRERIVYNTSEDDLGFTFSYKRI